MLISNDEDAIRDLYQQMIAILNDQIMPAVDRNRPNHQTTYSEDTRYYEISVSVDDVR
jgi:hypothetical protein